MMEWRIVKQPNGKYGRFSNIINNFTHMNMNNLEAYKICRHYTKAKTAKEIMQAADNKKASEDLFYDYYNWEFCMSVINIHHGTKEYKRIEKINKNGK